MGVSVIGAEGCRNLVDGLSKLIDFEKDLPANIFFGDEFKFWFFERPLFDFLDSFSGLIRVNLLSFNSDVLIKFSGYDLISGSCFSLGDSDIESDVLSIHEGFRDFFGGRVGYPIVIFNEGFDWVAFESAHEEIGVIGVRASTLKLRFVEFLDSNFISAKDIVELSDGHSADSRTAEALRKSYISTL